MGRVYVEVLPSSIEESNNVTEEENELDKPGPTEGVVDEWRIGPRTV